MLWWQDVLKKAKAQITISTLIQGQHWNKLAQLEKYRTAPGIIAKNWKGYWQRKK